jgi:hypothetical protein
MPTDNTSTSTLATAQTLLRQFTVAPTAAEQNHQLVQQALQLVVEHSDYQILGICADSLATAIVALHTYLTALSYEIVTPEASIKGAVYVKYNPLTGLCYATPYFGSDRGVLVSCQSAYAGEVNETFGHLPLNLFGKE